MVELAQIGAGAKSFGARAGKNQRVTLLLKRFKGAGEALELGESCGADLVAWGVVENEFDHAVRHLPGKCFAAKSLHALFFWNSCSISVANLAAIASRLSLPFTVSRPFSMVKGSGTT